MSAIPFCHCVFRVGHSREDKWMVTTWIASPGGSIQFQGKRYATVDGAVFPSEEKADAEKARRIVERGSVVR